MKAFFLILVSSFTFSVFGLAQTQVVTTPRTSPQATVAQTIGVTDVAISYSRPAVRGRNIWGEIVPFGMNNPGWGTSESAPWLAGADENTIISFSTDVLLNDVEVPAGTYGFFMVIEESGEVEIILSENTGSWGNYFYTEDEVVARAKISWEEHRFTEYLEYAFVDFTPNSV